MTPEELAPLKTVLASALNETGWFEEYRETQWEDAPTMADDGFLRAGGGGYCFGDDMEKLATTVHEKIVSPLLARITELEGQKETIQSIADYVARNHADLAVRYGELSDLLAASRTHATNVEAESRWRDINGQ